MKKIPVVYAEWQYEQGIKIANILTNAAAGKAAFSPMSYVTELFVEAKTNGINEGVIWAWNWNIHKESNCFKQGTLKAIDENLKAEAQSFLKKIQAQFKPSFGLLGEESGIELRTLIDFLGEHIELPEKMAFLASERRFEHKKVKWFLKPGGIGMGSPLGAEVQHILQYFDVS